MISSSNFHLNAWNFLSLRICGIKYYLFVSEISQPFVEVFMIFRNIVVPKFFPKVLLNVFVQFHHNSNLQTFNVPEHFIDALISYREPFR